MDIPVLTITLREKTSFKKKWMDTGNLLQERIFRADSG